ncbi:MucR family transcriptional regulator [Methylobacterium platani]|nr:MucR family transcriptional regulator [Methylobacterium platani]
MTADITASYVSRNRVYMGEVPDLIDRIHASLQALTTRQAHQQGQAQFRPSAAQVAASVKRNRIISFIDGQPYKSLKWQLAAHGLTPDQYRARFGLPATYPMVAPVYDRSLARAGLPPAAKGKR